MPSHADTPELDNRTLAELSALADGTLDPARRAEVQARISASPELSALYQHERRAVQILHEAGASDRAPARLRARIDAERPSNAVRARRRLAYGGGLAGALAAAVLAVVLLLPGGTPLAPSLSQAAAVALYGPTAPPPIPDPSAPGVKLHVSIEEVYFPNWQHQFGWTAVGQRTDTIDGRHATTVYYTWHGQTLAYTIVGAPALHTPAASTRWLNGTLLHTLILDHRLVVTWQRDGHTCILSATHVPTSVLQMLAAWKAPGLEHDTT
jgi:anti-sigma factor RsiW